MIVIDKNRTTTIVAGKADEEWLVNTGVKVVTTSLAIDASGAAEGRDFTINGTLRRTTEGAVMALGSPALGDCASSVKIGDVGTVRSAGAGLVARSGGVDVENVGRFETSGTALDLRGDNNTVVNSGILASGRDLAIRSHGRNDDILNNGAGSIEAHGHAVVATGNRTSVENAGAATIVSTRGSAIVVSGDHSWIGLTGTATAMRDAIVIAGKGTTVETSGEGNVASTAGRGIVSTAGGATLVLHADLKTRGDSVYSSGQGLSLTTDGEVRSTEGAGIRSIGDKAVITIGTSVKAATFGIFSAGDDAVITNNGNVQGGSFGARLAGDDAILTTSARLVGDIAISITGNDAVVTIGNEVSGRSKSDAAIVALAPGGVSITNHGSVHAKSGIAIETGKGEDSILNTGALNGDVLLGGGNDWFSSLKGAVGGDIRGGAGNDVFELAIAATIREKAGEGIDTVRSLYSRTLEANVENLELIGSEDMEATGNRLANRLAGNEGDNRLTGRGGADIFVFADNSGDDRIADFRNGTDRIDLSARTGIDRFSDFKGRIEASGADTVIRLGGGDSVVLEGVNPARIDASDFLF